MRSWVAKEELVVQLLLLHIEWCQLRGIRGLFGSCLLDASMESCSTMSQQEEGSGKSRTHWWDYVSQMVLKHLVVQPNKLEEVTKAREVWTSLLRQLYDRLHIM